MIRRHSRRDLILTSIAAGALASTGAAAQQASPVPPRNANWPFYGKDVRGTKSTEDAGISVGTVDSLVPAWEVEVAGPVSATPVIQDRTAYVGSYDGRLYAIDLHTGSVRWTYDTGAAVPEPNLQIPLGIVGSAAVVGGTVFVGDAIGMMHAVDAASGEPRWTARVDDQTHACIWSSPVISGNRLVVGVASVAKEMGFRGSVVALDAGSGEKLWQAYMVPEGSDGGAVFTVPAIDAERNRVYVGTQNAYSPSPAPFGHPTSVVALDLASGEVAWAFGAGSGDGDTAPTDDVAFSASANLFSAAVDGEQRDLVGIGQKSGDYWALDRDRGDVVWRATVSPAGFLGGMEGTSAVNRGIIAVPATNWPEFDGPASGLIAGLDAATGESLWTAEQEAPAASPAAISSDIVFHAGMDGVLHAYGLEDGDERFSVDLQASVSGGIAVGEGVVVLGAATPQIAPFVQPGSSVRAFTIQSRVASPVAAASVG